MLSHVESLSEHDGGDLAEKNPDQPQHIPPDPFSCKETAEICAQLFELFRQKSNQSTSYQQITFLAKFNHTFLVQGPPEFRISRGSQFHLLSPAVPLSPFSTSRLPSLVVPSLNPAIGSGSSLSGSKRSPTAICI